RVVIWVGIFFVAFASEAFADWEIGGRIAFELEGNNRYSTADLDKEGVLEIKTDRKKSIRGVFDLRVKADDNGLKVRDLYVDWKGQSRQRAILGQAKKRFGIEYQRNMEERL